jgi:radical SAM protein with 4Fe4S-binding SPASM domain
LNSRFSDITNFLKTLTISKLYNYGKLRFSYLISKITRNVVVNGVPASLSIEPTTSCNLQCPECPSGLRQFTRKTGFIEMDLYKKIINDSYKELIYLMLYFQGEPFLHPDFFNMLSYAKSKNIYTATSTNAHFLDMDNAKMVVDSGLDRIIISIDGITQKSYAKYRVGGKLDKVLEGTRNLVKAKKELKSKSPFIIFQFVVFRSNEHEVEGLQQLAKEIGVDKVQIKSAQFYNLSLENDLIPINPKYLRYKKADNQYVYKDNIPNKCWRSWHAPVITQEGNMVPCCFDKDASYELGDLKTEQLKTVFQGEQSRLFKKQILKERKQIDICRNCSEGIKVYRK